MFHTRPSPFDRKYPALEGAGKATVFDAHDFVNDLLRSILDADCIDNRPFLIGAAADALYPQLRRLSQGLPQQEAKTRAASVCKTFGDGEIDMPDMTEEGQTPTTVKVATHQARRLRSLACGEAVRK